MAKNQVNPGYSGTPLYKKLGMREGYIIRVINQPSYYFDLFASLDEIISFSGNKKIKKDIIHYFTDNAKQLFKDIPKLKTEI